MIELKNIGVKRDDWVLRNINLKIPQGSRCGIIGSSGAGKTTLLKLIAGLLDAGEGELFFEEKELKGPSVKLIPGYEDIQLVNQDFDLYLYHTVEQNIREKVLHLKSEDRDQLVKEMLELVELDRIKERKAHLLSGGEQQRLCLARAIACEPKVLLLDEPFVHLDQRLRFNVINYLLALNELRGTTIVLVSHDGAEVMGLVDRVLHVTEGAVVRDASVENMYYAPETMKEGELMGVINRVEFDGEEVLFRPVEYDENGSDIKVTYERSLDGGLQILNYFKTEKNEPVVLSANRVLESLNSFSVNKKVNNG